MGQNATVWGNTKRQRGWRHNVVIYCNLLNQYRFEVVTPTIFSLPLVSARYDDKQAHSEGMSLLPEEVQRQLDCEEQEGVQEQGEEQGEEQEGVQEGEQGEGQGEEQRQVQGQEQGEEQKGESEDEEDVPLAVLKQRRDAAYTAAKQKKRGEKKKREEK